MREASKYVKAWREDIRDQLIREWKNQPPLSNPIRVDLTFVMPRPKFLARIKLTPPAIKRPDLDKLARAAFDAITMAGVWKDDSQVIEAHLRKRIAKRGEESGVYIGIHALSEWYGLGGEDD